MVCLRDGHKGPEPGLGTALLRKPENSCNGGGRERRLIISIVQRRGREDGDCGRGAMAKSLEGWQLSITPFPGACLARVESGCHLTPH